MKILYTGADGQLGYEIKLATEKEGLSAIGITLNELDIAQAESVKRFVADSTPDLVINCAAYTAVDQAEKEAELAYAVNRDGAAHLAEACAVQNIPLIHISTDYVFDGAKQSAYLESDATAPANIYGKSKAAGEEKVSEILPRHIILRTSWLYGCYGNNFVKTMLRLGREREHIGVVDDQFGCPTHAADLAAATVTIANAIFKKDFSNWGIYHYCNQGIVSWYEFAKTIFEIARPNIPLKLKHLEALTTDQYPTPAARPIYSVLDVKKIGQVFGIDPPFYRSSLETMLSQLFAVSDSQSDLA